MSLTERETQKQIKQMIAFIEQEASEKAEEIDSKSEEEYQIEKGRLLQEQRSAVSEVYEKRRQQNELSRKIHASRVMNEARLRLLQEREDYMSGLLTQALQTLATLSQNQARYGQLLEGLVTQGMLQLMEDEVIVRCREADAGVVESVLSKCSDNYKQLCERDISASVDKQHYLRADSAGGVEVVTVDGRIKAINTMESRLEMLNEQMQPQLREILFGANANRKFRD